jgi:Heterokaryon incompatibility protein (HET)
LATQWINNCLSDHSSSCPFDAMVSLPTRVIDVGLDLEAPQVRVFETKGLQGTWVALSHCWGRIARFVTEISNLHERTQGIALSDLPNTFLDAIKVTRKLGYRYLWIDSLCILQDSHQDWVDESSRMQDYYSKAILTIASDLATGDHESFLDNARPQSTSATIPFNTKVTATNLSHVYISKDVKTPGIDPDVTPLSVRGWTLQEDILSPRTLHYTTAELIFSCQQSRFVETDVTPQGYNDVDQMRSIKRFFLRPKSGLTDPLLLKYPAYEAYYQPISRWYRLFENYCSRLLTFEADRLAAIAGLAKEIQRQTDFEYKAGLWAEDIHTGLLWAVNGRGERPETYRAPSWSWASLDIRFYWGTNINPNFELYMLTGNWDKDPDPESGRRAEVLACEVETSNGDPFGPVVSGRLRIKGYLLPLAEWKGSTETYINVFWSSIRSHQRGGSVGGIKGVQAADQLVCDFDLTPEDEDETSDSGDDVDRDEELSEEGNESEVEWRSDKYPPDVVLFQIQRHVRPGNELVKERAIFFCLLLEPTAQDNNPLDYRRVGIAEVPDINGLGRDGWEKREIVII